jgi:hypothetical protein
MAFRRSLSAWLENDLKEMERYELESHWFREKEGSRQGLIYLDELKESIFLSQDLGSDLGSLQPPDYPSCSHPPYIAPQTDGHHAGILQDGPYDSDVKKNDQAGQGDGKVDRSGTRSRLLWSRRGIVGMRETYSERETADTVQSGSKDKQNQELGLPDYILNIEVWQIGSRRIFVCPGRVLS